MNAAGQPKFHNIKPRTRAEREGMRDREAIEKMRLKERSGGYHQYEEFRGISNPETQSTLFISEADRFNKDFAAEDKRKREEEQRRRQMKIDKQREETAQRDLNRWETIESVQKRDDDRLAGRQARNQQGQKNNPTAAYNPITLEYDTTSQGQQLRRVDDQVRQRADDRMQNLDTRMNSGYNILTGEVRKVNNQRPF